MQNLGDLLTNEDEADTDKVIRRALRAVREHLGMEIAYLSEIVDGQSVFRAIDSDIEDVMVGEGDTQPMEHVYCGHILAGRLPKLMPDVSREPLAVSMPITQAVPIGSHVSVPIHRDDGSVYGMFCCLSSQANASLNERDLNIMEMFAELSASRINETIAIRTRQAETARRIQEVMEDKQFTMAYQPIFDLHNGALAGFEALARFKPEPYRAPNIWFDEAESVGMGLELELAAIGAALMALPVLPDDQFVSINAAPQTVSSGRIGDIIAPYPHERIVLEITEHALADSPEQLFDEIEQLRFKGVKLAIDDVGAGYSGLAQIVGLSPNIIKLDRSLVTDIDRNRARFSLVKALVYFAEQTGSRLVAEGIERSEELEALVALGVHRGQGYLLGRPAPLTATVEQTQRSMRRRAS